MEKTKKGAILSANAIENGEQVEITFENAKVNYKNNPNIADWLKVENVTTEQIEKQFGKCLFVVVEIYDSKGNKKTNGQKTFGLFQKDKKMKLVDKSTITDFFGVKKDYTPKDGTTGKKTDENQKQLDNITGFEAFLMSELVEKVGIEKAKLDAAKDVLSMCKKFVESQKAKDDSEKQIAQLKKEQKKAVDDDDFDKVKEITEKIIALKKQTEDGNKEQTEQTEKE